MSILSEVLVRSTSYGSERNCEVEILPSGYNENGKTPRHRHSVRWVLSLARGSQRQQLRQEEAESSIHRVKPVFLSISTLFLNVQTKHSRHCS